MKETLVVDASVAVKWVVTEEGTESAVALRAGHEFLAPGLMLAECCNILWKKARLGELSRGEAEVAAKLLERSGVGLAMTHGLSGAVMRLALSLDHPAYDCVYLALAESRNLRFVTADRRFLAKVKADRALSARCVALGEATAPLRPR